MPNYTLYYFNGRGRAEICRMMFAAAGVKYTDKRIEFSEWDRCRNDFPCMWLPCLEMDGGMKMPETMSICRYLAREFNFYPQSNMDMFRCDYISDCFYEIMDDYMKYFHWKNGRFRYNYMENGIMSSGMMGSGMGSGMSSGMMQSGMQSGMMQSGMQSGMMQSEMQSGMTGSNMSGGMMGSNMGSGDMMNSNFDNYMHWRYMNTFNRTMSFMERTLSMKNGGNQFFMGEQMMWCDMMMYCCMESMYNENQSMFSSYPKMMALYQRVAQHTKISSYLKSRCMTNW